MDAELLERIKKTFKREFLGENPFWEDQLAIIIVGAYILGDKNSSDISAFLNIPEEKVNKCLAKFEGDEKKLERVVNFLDNNNFSDKDAE